MAHPLLAVDFSSGRYKTYNVRLGIEMSNLDNPANRLIRSTAELIKKHEGLILTAKPDEKGKWCIGYGHDIPAPPAGTVPTCTQAQADDWFSTDIALAALRAKSVIGVSPWLSFNPPRQAALIDMAYELGGEGLAGFHEMIDAARSWNWGVAWREALRSEWAKQVPSRAREDAMILLTGDWPK
jgi:lysozyme